MLGAAIRQACQKAAKIPACRHKPHHNGPRSPKHCRVSHLPWTSMSEGSAGAGSGAMKPGAVIKKISKLRGSSPKLVARAKIGAGAAWGEHGHLHRERPRYLRAAQRALQGGLNRGRSGWQGQAGSPPRPCLPGANAGLEVLLRIALMVDPSHGPSLCFVSKFKYSAHIVTKFTAWICWPVYSCAACTAIITLVCFIAPSRG